MRGGIAIILEQRWDGDDHTQSRRAQEDAHTSQRRRGGWESLSVGRGVMLHWGGWVEQGSDHVLIVPGL